METDGVFNGKKVIDIEEYAKRYESVKKNYISAPYYLEDLIKWGQYGIEYVNEEQQSVNDSAKANTIYSYEYEMEEAGDALVPMNATLTLESAEIVDYYTADGWKLVERYKTIDQLGLGAYVDKNHTYDQLCQYLEQAAKSLTYNYSQYKKYNQVFQDNMTNLSYYIALQNDDGTKTVYTNIEVGSLEEAIGYIRDMGRYIYYDATSLTYDTNTNLSEENLIQEISNYDYTYAGNSQIVIGIDTNYLYQDSFLEGYSNYTKIIPQIPMFILLCIISFLVLVVFFFISCYTVGKSDKDSKEVRLVLSDHIYTEVFFLFGIAFIVGLGALIFLILQELYNYQISNRAICISAGVGTFLLYSLLISFLLGVLRRVKAKQLWKNSILRAICILLKKGILAGTGFIKKQINECKDNGSLIVNVWVPYLCFIGLQLLFIPFGIPGLCILMIIDKIGRAHV